MNRICMAKFNLIGTGFLILTDLIILQAHEQLRAVLLTLLEELPSDLPILLLGTSSVQLAEVDEEPISVFPHYSVYVKS